MKRIFSILAVVFVLFVGVVSLNGCSSCDRTMKSIGSDFDGGLDRTVTLYDYNGNVLGEWSGKFDMSSSEEEIFFDDENGKRVIIHGGIVVAEEN